MNDAYWDKNYKKITKKTIKLGQNSLGMLSENRKEIKTEEWFEPINSETSQIQEEEIINFIENEIVPKVPKEGEVGAENIWIDLFINWVKQLAIEAASRALEYLFDKGVDWAIDGAKFALERLQDFLFEKYQTSSDTKQKENFKKKILEKFPESGLASKLRNEASEVLGSFSKEENEKLKLLEE